MPRRICPILVAVIAIGAAAPAQAAITQSNITAPADGTHYLNTDANPKHLVPLTGTSNGTTGDKVDIRCYERADAFDSGNAAVPVAADGSFSTTMDTGTPYGTCVLRAVPAGLPKTSDASPFTGPTLTTEWTISDRTAGGPNNGTVYDLYVAFQGSNAFNDYVSSTSGGLFDSRLQDGPANASTYLWYENASLVGNTTVPNSTRSNLQVDGRNAYGPTSAHSLLPDNPGFPALTFDAARDPGTGNTTIHETNPIVVCPNEAPFPPTAGSCPQFNSAGVRLDRTYFTDDGGRQVHITDTWRSTDGAAHTLSLHYDQTVEATSPPNNTPVSSGLKLPWIDDFQTFSSDTTFPGPSSGPGSLFVEDNHNAPDGDTTFPRGAVSFDLAPNAVRRVTNELFQLHDENFAVPAGGTTVVRQDFVIGHTEAEVEAKAAANVARFRGSPPNPPAGGLKLSISSPADGSTMTGSTRTQPITVTGSASADRGVASLVLNGVPVTLAGNGTFSVPTTVSLGDNRFTAVARDAAGTSTTASVGVRYVDNGVPAVGAFTANPRTFAVASTPTAITARAKKGTTFKLNLSEDSNVSINIARALPGKRKGRRCVKPTKKLRRAKRCQRLASRGTLHRRLGAGNDSVKFSGRLGRKKLAPGSYVASITAVDDAGNRSAKKSVKLRIVRR